MTLPKITNKELVILTLIYKFRFLNRTQIQTLLKHKDHRRIQAWLNDLTDKKCLGRIYSPKIPVNTKPAVYYLGENGRKILAHANPDEYTTVQLQNTYRDSQRTEVYRLRCICIADCFIRLISPLEENTRSLTEFITPADTAYSQNDSLTTLAPDSYFEIKELHTERTAEFTLFLLHERTPKYYLKFRLAHIINFCKETLYDREDFQPQILIICTKERIRRYAIKIITSKLEKEGSWELTDEFSINLITLYEFVTKGFTGDILTLQAENEDNE
jgi:hypothetical protein